MSLIETVSQGFHSTIFQTLETFGEHLDRARAALNCQSCDDRRRRSAAQAAGRVERVDAEELVDEAARDAKHSRAAVLALGVELEGPDLGVVVAHPRVERDVAGLGVVGLRLGRKASAGFLHARQDLHY